MRRNRGRSSAPVAGGGPVPGRLAGLRLELVDRADRDLHLLVTEDDGAQHDLLAEHLGFRLDHQHGVSGSRDDEVESCDVCRSLFVGFSRYSPLR